MNGTFALPSPLEVTLSKAAWTAPASNEAVTIGFKQHDRRHRRAAHRRLLQDADVHAVNDESIAAGTRRRQLEHELRAAAGSVGGADAPAVLLGDLADDRQPEARSRGARARTRRGRSGRRGAGDPSGSTPVPWSRTRTPCTSDVHLDERRPGGECLAALSSRLLTARASRSRVPSTTAGCRSASKWIAGRVAARAGDRLARRGGRGGRPRSRAAARRRARARSGPRPASRARSSAPRRRPAAARARRAAAPRTRPAPRCSCAGW